VGEVKFSILTNLLKKIRAKDKTKEGEEKSGGGSILGTKKIKLQKN